MAKVSPPGTMRTIVRVLVARQVVPAPQRGQHGAHALAFALGVIEVDVDAKASPVGRATRAPLALGDAVRQHAQSRAARDSAAFASAVDS